MRTTSLRMVLTLARMTELNILQGDCSHAYLNAECGERVWTYMPEEFGPELAGRRAIIRKAIDGLGSSGRAWRKMIGKYLIDEMGFYSSRRDAAVFMKLNEQTNKYEYILLYVDDFIIAAEDPNVIAEKIHR